jgi:hypothetical protein
VCKCEGHMRVQSVGCVCVCVLCGE